jgi:hypothetical protein
MGVVFQMYLHFSSYPSQLHHTILDSWVNLKTVSNSQCNLPVNANINKVHKPNLHKVKSETSVKAKQALRTESDKANQALIKCN